MSNNKVQLIEAKRGRFLVQPNDIYIGQSLLHYGEYCDDEIKLLSSVLSRKNVVIDGGANIGALSIPLAAQVPDGRVVSFEPQQVIFQLLCANAAVNNLMNLTALPYGLGDEEKALYFDIAESYHQTNNFGAVSLSDAGSQKVQVKKLDDVVADLGLKAVDLIKLDIEGMEKQALLGAEKTIDQYQPFLYIENDRPGFLEWFMDWVGAKNYRVFLHVTNYFRENNFFGCTANMTPGASTNLFCYCVDRHLPDETAQILQTLGVSTSGCEIKDARQMCYEANGNVSWQTYDNLNKSLSGG